MICYASILTLCHWLLQAAPRVIKKKLCWTIYPEPSYHTEWDHSEDEPGWLSEYKADCKRREEATEKRAQEAQQRHTEKMDMMQKILEQHSTMLNLLQTMNK